MRCASILCPKPINVFEIILTTAAIFVLLFSEAAFGQNTATHNSTKASPRIGVAFSKAAVRALLTIEGTRDKGLLDAAMIDLSAAHSTHAELTVVWHVQLFQEIYGIHEMIEAHDEDQACIVAWLPRLRALSAEVPKQCP